MPSRHRSRQRAVQVMFLWDARRQLVDEAIASFYRTLASDETAEGGDVTDPRPIDPDPFMELLVRGASGSARQIDELIQASSANWRLDRMAAVDRNILRLAIHEMRTTETPAPVVIDEALELARQFSGQESVPFINGILDAVHHSLNAKRALGAKSDAGTGPK